MNKKQALLLMGCAATLALFLARPSPSVELDAGPLDAEAFTDEDGGFPGDGGEPDYYDEYDLYTEDAGDADPWDGGPDELLDASPAPLPLPDEEPEPAPPDVLAPPVERELQTR